ncbi:hypothetical protein F4815DRAFT_446017 [Daldinia loculata]|uniref:uncharacterized protein n=1 Tax=Daldinia loculata TaxID=103429 RepID=UPI0020C37CE5|nr:uncharacterized protein F4817DRAFT_283829 [Daldinia loculata]KAI1650252.1 hypothetical protein F4817DRAFT_283829 [Daldinia loculata]KAI2779826.1 hypothetical protein F4815DRAFT_446017 [Daldinia loculata]
MAFRFRTLPRLFQPALVRVQPTTVTTAPRLFRGPVQIQMASITAPPPGKYEWLVVVPDKPGTREKRLEVRAQHFEGLKPYVESKQFKTGGAVLNDKPESDDPATFDWYGSTLVLVAESKEEVKAILEKDIYTRTGVWDTEKALILAAKYAFRFP